MPAHHLQAVFFKMAADSSLEYITQRNPQTGAVEKVRNEGFQDQRNWYDRAGGMGGITDKVTNAAGRVLPSITKPGLAASLMTGMGNLGSELAMNKDYHWNNFFHGNSGGAKRYKYYAPPEAPKPPAPKGIWNNAVAGVGAYGKGVWNGAASMGERITAPVHGQQVTFGDQGYWSSSGPKTNHGYNSPAAVKQRAAAPAYKPTWSGDFGTPPPKPPGGSQTLAANP